MSRRLDARACGFAADFEALLAEKREVSDDVDAVARDILAAVRRDGDAAVLDLTRRLDRVEAREMADLRVGAEEIERAVAACPQDALDALDLAARRITAFHERQRPEGWFDPEAHTIRLGLRWSAVDAAGIYVPGGTAAYPSSVLMNALPARVAGVERLVMVVPAPDGALAPLVLAAAKRAGVEEIWKIGGAQAVAALAYGTASIKPVDKIVGPGNAYVAAAKRLVYGTVGIDSIAGPSEIVVVADRANDPAWIAADLLSQAEHDVAAQAILITDDTAFAEAVALEAERQLATLPRRAIAGESWRRFGAIIEVGNLSEAPALVDRLAPEHLELAVADPLALAERIRHAGAIFLGRYAPEALGDYVAGPNHVLPTARTARFSSGLGVFDFMKRTTLIACDAEGLGAIGPAAIRLAEAEGLEAHARSVRIRLDRSADGDGRA